MLSKISISEDEEHDQHDIDIDIDIVPQDDLNPDLAPISNQNPKWAQKLNEAVENGAGNPDDKRRMRSQYQNEHVALSHTKFATYRVVQQTHIQMLLDDSE